MKNVSLRRRRDAAAFERSIGYDQARVPAADRESARHASAHGEVPEVDQHLPPAGLRDGHHTRAHAPLQQERRGDQERQETHGGVSGCYCK